jgi:hypothetical protein
VSSTAYFSPSSELVGGGILEKLEIDLSWQIDVNAVHFEKLLS